jgi:entericidin A
MNKIVAIVLMGFTLVITGCNTWHGFGKDLEKLGDKIQKSPNNR